MGRLNQGTSNLWNPHLSHEWHPYGKLVGVSLLSKQTRIADPLVSRYFKSAATYQEGA